MRRLTTGLVRERRIYSFGSGSIDVEDAMIVVYRLIFSFFHVVQRLMRICRKGLLVTGGKIDVRTMGFYGPQVKEEVNHSAEGNKSTRKSNIT